MARRNPIPSSPTRRLTIPSAAVSVALGALPLSAGAQERLEEIVITSSMREQPRRQIGTAVAVIDSAELELRGYNDLADALRTQTGIGVNNSGGPGKSTAVRIRGEESYRTLLFIDGVKAVDPSAPQVAPSFDSLLTTGDLQRVEVLRGPQGFIYGADAGGVISILTARGEGSPRGRVGIEYGEFDTAQYDVAVSGGGGTGDYFFSVTDLNTDGFNAQTGDTVLRDDDGADNTTLHTKLGWTATQNLRLQLVARDIDASTMYDGCFTATFALVHDCVGTTDQTTYKVSADYGGERVRNDFAYSELTIDRDSLTQGISTFRTSGEITRLEYTGSFDAADAATFVYGFDLQEEKVNGTMSSRARDQDGYYAEYQGDFADSFFVTLGARYDDSEDFGSHTSARLSLAYVQDLGRGRSLKYRGSAGTGFRAPSLFETTYNERPTGVHPDALANPLTEEQSTGYDIGIEYANNDGFFFDITYFNHEIEDQISYVSQPVTFFDGYVQTPGFSESDGVEIGLEAPFGERWAFLANWTHNDATTATGDARLQRPENLGNLGIRYRSRSEALSFIANYRISRDAVDFGNVPLDDYGVLDLAVNYAINETFDVYGRFQNALDEEYREVNHYNTADRAVYAGARLKF
jgi:vitamin B12 transporter